MHCEFMHAYFLELKLPTAFEKKDYSSAYYGCYILQMIIADVLAR